MQNQQEKTTLLVMDMEKVFPLQADVLTVDAWIDIGVKKEFT